MSGDVQPRKRKDKKKKKDDLGIEEPRGTSATLGDGDVFMHSQSDHGTGGHWCAKIIFFSLLGVLITLIGLIILENRGLSELEANSVESRYSGVLEGWIEDAIDDDHHDAHTLELNHHDDDDDDEEHGSELVHDDEHDEGDDEHNDDDDDEQEDDDDDEQEDVDDEREDADDDENEEAGQNNDDDDDDEEVPDDNDSEGDNDEDDENPESEEQDTADNEDEIEETVYKKYYDSDDKANEDDDNNDDGTQNHENNDDNDADFKNENDDLNDNYDEKDDDHDNDDDVNHHNDRFGGKDNESEEDSPPNNISDEDDDSEEDNYLQNAAPDKEDEKYNEEEENEPANIEVETIEKEITDDDAVSTEESAKEVEEETQDVSEELPPEDDGSMEDDDVEFLEPDELDELPIVEPITAPKGKPLAEVGEAPSTEKPQDTLAEEEEYERQQEELRKEREQASQGMWLKLTVGGALLVATHAVLRRATASRETDTEDEPDIREDAPLSDRRRTLVPEPPPTVASKKPEDFRPTEKDVKKETTVVQAPPPSKVDEDDEEFIFKKPFQPLDPPKDTVDKEFYSDEDELEDEIEEDEEEIEPPIPQQLMKPLQQTAPQTQIPDVTKEVTPEPDEEDDDVEIIDEDLLEEELEEEISDVDDAELLNRLEAKYGRLPEPDRPGRMNKDGGNNIEDDWPGEPVDEFWSEHLEQAERDLRQGEWRAALVKASAPKLQSSGRARFVAARALDLGAEAKKDNQLLGRAIAAYMEVLKMNERLSDLKVLEVATRALDRIKFRGTYLSAEPVYKLLIRRFPNEPTYRNNLTISFLMANRADLAESVITETLKLWPNDRIALAHLGFILKTSHNRLEEAVDAFTKALEGDTGPANEPRFYYHLGDALLLLGRFSEAQEIHKRGAALGHFLSPVQRSLYNVDRLVGKPWWDVNQTPYSKLARALEKSWREILKEGEAAKALYEKEKEGLKERGEWSQLDLFTRGREVPNRCTRAPVTCGIVNAEVAASGCRRGQIKFSMMAAGTHVRPHVGPTNCRLRMHLGLSNTKDTFIRVDQEIRQWHLGKVLMFDDSFEHEVWHNGTGTRLVLIVDVWHPDLTPKERRQLPAI